MISLLIARTATAQNEYDEAVRRAAEAFAIQSGLREDAEQYAMRLERRFVPVFVKQHGGWVVFLVQTFRNDKVWIAHKWEF